MVSLIVRKAFEPFIAVPFFILLPVFRTFVVISGIYHDMLKSLINLGEILADKSPETVSVFFLFGFSFTNIHDSQDIRERGRLSLQLLSATTTRSTDT